MKKRTAGLPVICAFAALAGCNNNPFPEDSALFEKKPPEARVVLPPYALDVPGVMDFQEDRRAEYKILANVPSGEKAMLAAYDLPPGAVFSDSKIIWTPSSNAANDPQNPAIVVRSYPIRIVLRTENDALTSIERTAVLLVRDTPRKFEIQVLNRADSPKEGSEFLQEIKLHSDDFPRGPFQLTASNLPAGAGIVADPRDPTHFTIKYNPDFRAVTIDDTYNYIGDTFTKDLKINLVASAPRALQAEATIDWRIRDVRKYARVIGPTRLTQGLDVNFTISAEDLNGEIDPRVMVDPQPSYGSISVRPLPKFEVEPEGLNPASNFVVQWNNITADHLGKTDTLNFKICVNRNRTNQDLCNRHSVSVTFSNVPTTAPASPTE